MDDFDASEPRYFLGQDVTIQMISNPHDGNKQLHCLTRGNALYAVPEPMTRLLSTLPATRRELMDSASRLFQVQDKSIAEAISKLLDYLHKNGLVDTKAGPQGDISSTPPLSPGEELHGHVIESLISERRSVRIYTAKNKGSQRLVVLKTIRQERPDSDRLAEILRREYEVQTACPPHTCIASNLGFFPDPPTLAIEYADGRSLRHVATQRFPDPRIRLDLCLGAIQAIAHLHTHEVVHGDAHVSNFLGTDDGQVKLIDFDLSRRHPGDCFSAHGRHGGVPHFIPPERASESSFALSSRAPDFRGDVYQVGGVMYYVLYGKMPFEGFTWSELRRKMSTGLIALPPVGMDGLQINESVQGLLARCLAPNPDNRPKNANVIMAEWHACVSE